MKPQLQPGQIVKLFRLTGSSKLGYVIKVTKQGLVQVQFTGDKDPSSVPASSLDILISESWYVDNTDSFGEQVLKIKNLYIDEKYARPDEKLFTRIKVFIDGDKFYFVTKHRVPAIDSLQWVEKLNCYQTKVFIDDFNYFRTSWELKNKFKRDFKEQILNFEEQIKGANQRIDQLKDILTYLG